MTPAELAEHFPAVDDLEDIAHSADDTLNALAGHMAVVVLAERAVRAARALWRAIDGEADAPAAPDAWRTRAVICAPCVSFVHSVGYPHAGTCAANAPERTSAVVWDDDTRTCSRFEATA